MKQLKFIGALWLAGLFFMQGVQANLTKSRQATVAGKVYGLKHDSVDLLVRGRLFEIRRSAFSHPNDLKMNSNATARLTLGEIKKLHSSRTPASGAGARSN